MKYNVVVTKVRADGCVRRHIIRRGIDAEFAERIRQRWENDYRRRGRDGVTVTVEAA